MIYIVVWGFIAFGFVLFMWSVSNSLRQIARDVRVIASHFESKPIPGDPDRFLDA